MTWAMVTGASSGLGAEFARQLADAGYDLLVVSRDADALGGVADEVRSRGREAEVVVADLSVADQVARVAGLFEDGSREIEVLVNNAGYGLGEPFATSDVAAQRASLDVMVTAVMELSHAAARAMVARSSGQILAVASIASLLVSGTYSAHKAWVKVFSESLAGEVGPRGVHVCASMPGLVRTDFHRRADIDYSGLPGWVWVQPKPVVRASLAAVRRGRVLVVPTARYKLFAAVLRAVPRPLLRRLQRTRVDA